MAWAQRPVGRAPQQRGVGGALVQGKGCHGRRNPTGEAGGKARWLERAGVISVLPCKALLNVFLGLGGDGETGPQLHASLRDARESQTLAEHVPVANDAQTGVAGGVS